MQFLDAYLVGECVMTSVNEQNGNFLDFLQAFKNSGFEWDMRSDLRGLS